MNTDTILKPEIRIAGTSVRTTNAAEAGPNGRLPKLWESYFRSGIASRTGIDNPHLIYALYTDYESDATGAYTVLIGHELGEGAPSDELDRAVIPQSEYLVFSTKRGPVYEVVAQAWGDIWAFFKDSPSPLKRTYTGDFELYDAREFDPENAQIDIYIAVGKEF